MKNVVVTGGAGFIGSHLTRELVSEGHNVIVFDDLSTGKPSNISHLISDKSIRFVQGSTTDLPQLQELFSGVDSIFHLAAIPSVPRSVAEPVLSHEVNATGTLNVLVAAKDNRVKRVVFSSSAAVYGDTLVLPTKEDTFPEPLSPYAVSKLAAEYYCSVFQKLYGLSTISLRYFNVFGPRQDPDSQYATAIVRFISNCLKGEPPVIFGNGEHTRDYTYVEDIISANLLVEQSDAVGVFNISRGIRVSVNELAARIIELTGSSVQPVHSEPRLGDILHSLADISKAETFGYKPMYDLKEGLAETVKWFKDN